MWGRCMRGEGGGEVWGGCKRGAVQKMYLGDVGVGEVQCRRCRRGALQYLEADSHRVPSHALGVGDEDLVQILTKSCRKRRNLCACAAAVACASERFVADVE